MTRTARTIARTTAALAVAAAVLGGAGVALAATDAPTAAATTQAMALPASGEDQTGTDAPADTPTPTEETAASTAVSGAITGTVTSTEVSCTSFGGGAFSWELIGTLDGATPVHLTYTTAAYHGADTYDTSSITDERGGLLVLETDTRSAVTNGFTPGTFVVDAGEQSGSVDADLLDGDLTVHVSGSWTCG